MERVIKPSKTLSGALRLPGDKSISHRYGLLAAIATGETRIRNYAPGADCASTLACVAQLGAGVERKPVQTADGLTVEDIVITGRGLRGLTESAQTLDAGNSGSTMRMLSGILAGQNFRSVITGDESLQRRPMRRIMYPLAQMGAKIQATNDNFPPLAIEGTALRGIDYLLPVASAQVKSAVLLAGLLAEGETTVSEPVVTRDHTEIALTQFGAAIARAPRRTMVRGGQLLYGQRLEVPGDLSSAAFFLCAALMLPDSNLYLQGVGLNPTRTELLDFLASLGAKVQMLNLSEVSGELIGDLHVSREGNARLQGGRIEGEMVAGLIDEIPVLAILGTQTQDGLELRDAKELRIKETDRIETVAQNLRRMGAEIETLPDGFNIPGKQTLQGTELDSFGDHRIAMAFAVAALVAQGESRIKDADAAVVSYPGFYDDLSRVSE
ncbi:MAG: 3-phosphoshikimate 1-carboxyvinyltransferase [Acidobacteria bacterium]|nr:3-phosphoshikimate 1-carboxyvinyltransferase [Acidobacteriota bacterium]